MSYTRITPRLLPTLSPIMESVREWRLANGLASFCYMVFQTHLSMSEISDSIATNYPQLVQGQTPRWLTTAERREYKTNSTIVMTLTGDIKKASIGRQNLIVCNRECQLDDYIAYGWSTQCHNSQTYGHPAALCQNDSCCAICAGPHNTHDHPCTLPTCKKGPTCTHPLIRCVNCNAPHKANDANCPERIRL